MGLNEGKKFFYSWHCFTVLTLCEDSDARSNVLKNIGTMDTEEDENSEDDGDEVLEGVNGGATEYKVTNLTENRVYAVIYSA